MSDQDKIIVPVQKWLFDKYAPEITVEYINVEKEDINTWGLNVLKRLPNNEFIVFGLADFLPINKLNIGEFNKAIRLISNTDIDRFELSWSAPRGRGLINKFYEDEDGIIQYLEYGLETNYSSSVQFSIWRTSSLRKVLSKSTTPWNFEKNHRVKAACFSEPPFRWIEESALSGRHPGKINVLGLRPDDIEELIEIGFIDRSKIQYGMPKGSVPEFDRNNVGLKYQEFYQ